eukprot:6037031-Amphidinium_carterae.1
MLRDAGSPDEAFADQMCKGLPLAGTLPASGYFDRTLRFAPMSVSQLEEMAPALRAAVVSSIGPMEDPDLDAHISQGTADEVRRGWLDGPHNESSLDLLLGPNWVCSRRFAVRQGEK